MIWLIEHLESLRDFFEAGGTVLLGVFGITILMWAFIFERLWYFRAIHPGVVDGAVKAWEQRQDTTSWYAKRIRERLISEVKWSAGSTVPLIRMCVALAPLFGLLGTVTGMIQVFDVMGALGTSNPRAMASGVSAATIPTMAGMVAALSGIYFAISMEAKVRTEVERVEDLLKQH